MPRKKADDKERQKEIDDIWPRDEKPADPEKFLDFVAELADGKTKKEIEKIEVETAKIKRIIASNGDCGLLQDMQETVLDGRLGELCERFMLLGKRFPLAYAW